MRVFKKWAGALMATAIVATFATVAEARKVISYKGVSRGAILIDTSERRLYYGLGNGKAIRYTVGVGRRGKQWTGSKIITSKRLKPAWRPTAQILRDKPNMKRLYKGGERGNPMGAAALLLSGGGQYAIHGTNNPGSIGGFVSYGCIRMRNSDIKHLYARVGFGTRVTVRR